MWAGENAMKTQMLGSALLRGTCVILEEEKVSK
jgi:hypothetical protein